MSFFHMAIMPFTLHFNIFKIGDVSPTLRLLGKVGQYGDPKKMCLLFLKEWQNYCQGCWAWLWCLDDKSPVHLLDLISRRIYKFFFHRRCNFQNEKWPREVRASIEAHTNQVTSAALPLPHSWTNIMHIYYDGRVEVGAREPSISILPIERPHVYVRKRWVRHVPAPLAMDMFFLHTVGSRTPVTRMA